LQASPGPVGDSAAARAALRDFDRLVAEGRRDAADSALDRAARAAPGDFAVQAFVIEERWTRVGARATRELYRTWDAGDADVSACLRTATHLPSQPTIDHVNGDSVVARLRAMRDGGRAAECARRFLLIFEARSDRRGAPETAAVADLERLTEERDDVPVFALHFIRALRRTDLARIPAVCARWRSALRHTLARIEWEIACVEAQLQIGDSVGARARYRALEDAVRRDGRPGVRLKMLVGVSPALHALATPTREFDSRFPEAIALATDMGDWWQGFALRGQYARRRIERGAPAEAIALLDTAILIASQHGTARDRGTALVWRGRAHGRLGQRPAGLADLRAAIAILTDSGDTYDLAEAWHNLAHAYEREARWSEAAAAVDRFAALTAPFRWDGTRVIARRDAAEIKRKAGWIAAADEDARAMIAMIRDQDHNHQWAGEHLERRGELRAALEMYRAGVERGRGLNPLDVAGMARMYAALGRLDSAAMAARRHDALRADWRPGEVPLLPDVLAAQGDAGAAARLLAEWATTRTAGADQHSAALAQLAWGRMALRARDLTSAERAARAADSLAVRAASPSDAVAARLLRARTLALRGQRSASIELALAASRDPALREFPLLRVEALVTVGDVASGAASDAARLGHYAEAAAIVDAVSGALDADRDRSAYRARHLAPFDSALALSARGPANPAAVTRWSGRRKATSLRLTLRAESSRPAPIPSLQALQARIGPRAVFIDISVLGDQSVLLVVTATHARAVRVATGTAFVDSLVRRARRGMDAVARGRVDVARIRVDTAALRRLSDMFLAPIAEDLRGATRLVVSADGALQSLPLEMLPLPGRDGVIVLDAFTVRYVPGPWAVGAPPRAVRGPVVVVGQPAPGADDEIRAVQSAWSVGRVRTLEGDAATEEALGVQRQGAGVLHLLAHAIADPVETDASHLRLARGAVDDGFLHVGEVSAWRGAPALVVLSACGTASGAALLGEGPFSLTRAFLGAGAREVVATQWPVGAAAARFSDVLHRELARGRTTEDAVASARRALRADAATAHPFYWAPFILVANDSP
jgi:tetratricopeptide (TPR) repeat protein